MSNIIIGGGITGLYLAYKLNQLHPNYPLTIFEKTNRLGGRIYTKTKNDIKYDIGGARFSKNHLILRKLIEDLNLSKDVITLSKRKHYFIDGKFIKTDKKLLDYYKVKRFDSIKMIWEHVAKSTKKYSKDKFTKMTVYEVLKDILKDNEVKVLINSYLYNTKIYNSNAYTTLPSIYSDYDVMGTTMYVLNGGTERIIDKLHKILVKNGVTIMLLHDVLNINKTCLTVSNNNKRYSVKYKNLFLCVTRFDVLNFTGLFSKSNLNLISKSLNTCSLMRIYAKYPVVKGKSWFSNLPKILTDNKLQFIIPINPKTGLIMISYTSDKLADYWNNLKDNKEVVDKIHCFLNVMFPKLKIPTPDWVTIHYWKKATHYWNPGYNPDKVKKILNKYDNIHVLGEAFSNRQAWIEGGLEMVAKLLDSNIKLSKTKLNLTNLKSKKNKKNKEDTLPFISKTEVKKHTTRKSLWSYITDPKTKVTYVYNLTDWIDKHPGGSSHILSIGGKDATKKFYGQKIHPIEKIEKFIFPKYRIGILK